MKKSAFTLMEILIAMSIIGVIAAATANNIKNVAANKTKQTFQNCYNHILQTVADIASDETIYPVVENINAPRNGLGKFPRLSMCTLGINFPEAFANRSKTTNLDTVTRGFHFETPNGVYWVVKKQADNNSCQNSNFDKSNNADYVVLFDIDGPNEGNNCPYNITNIGSGSNCAKPDTFLFGISANNEVIADNNSNIYNGKKLMQFMKDNNYLQTK